MKFKSLPLGRGLSLVILAEAVNAFTVTPWHCAQLLHQSITMNLLNSLSLLSGLAITTVIASALPAQAFSTFSFTTNSTYRVGQEKSDILLQSVVKNGETITKFNTVNNAKIVQQNSKTINGKVHGLMSTNCGDNVSNCVSAELPSSTQVVEALGNLNLNKIIDTEEFLGSSVLDVFFQKPSDSFYLFERGGAMGSTARAGNSDLRVQAIDAEGNLLGQSFTIGKNMWTNAGYAIDTKEIDHAQKVGSFGLSSNNGAIAGLRLITNSTGADYKVIASSSRSVSAKVPEPATLVGLAAIGGTFALRRRKLAK